MRSRAVPSLFKSSPTDMTTLNFFQRILDPVDTKERPDSYCSQGYPQLIEPTAPHQRKRPPPRNYPGVMNDA